MAELSIFACAVFAASLGAILYVLAIYPLLLHRAASRQRREIQRDEVLRSISVIIAVRNGAKFIGEKLRSLLSAKYPRELMQIIVVSDGSDDGTDEIVRSFASEGVAFYRIARAGKPAALNTGISHATGEILILTDVRQTLDPDSIRNVVSCFADPVVGVVSGELLIRPGISREEADTGLYWKYEVFIRKQMSRIDSTFGANGPFYGMRRCLAVHIPEDTLLDDVYLPLSAFFRGYRMILDDSARSYDYPTSLTSEFHRKLRTQAGLYQILRTYPELLSSRNRMRIHFLSAKFGRLMIPFFLILMAVSTFGLPAQLMRVALAFQIVFYLFAALDSWIPQDSVVKVVSSPIRTFVVLMGAALLGLSVFFVPPQKLWKQTKVRL